MAKAVSLVVYDPDGMKEGETFPPHTKYRDGKLQEKLIEDRSRRVERKKARENKKGSGLGVLHPRGSDESI